MMTRYEFLKKLNMNKKICSYIAMILKTSAEAINKGAVVDEDKTSNCTSKSLPYIYTVMALSGWRKTTVLKIKIKEETKKSKYETQRTNMKHGIGDASWSWRWYPSVSVVEDVKAKK